MGMMRKAAIGTLIVGIGAVALSRNKKLVETIKKRVAKGTKKVVHEVKETAKEARKVLSNAKETTEVK